MRRRKKTHREFVFRKIIQMEAIFVIAFLLLIILIMQIGNQKIANLEKSLGVNKISFVQMERLSVKQELAKYVNSLPLPEEEILEENNKEIVVSTVEVVQFTESDAMLLARLMHAEEGILRVTESPEDAKRAHMLAGSVVLRRLETNYLGAKTLEDVIYAPGQYASVGNLYQPVPEETVRWAQELIDNGPIGPSNMIYQAEFEQGSDTYDQIGNQFFCIK